MKKLKNLSNNIDPFGMGVVRREILKTEATKKFIENRIKEILIDNYFHPKVLKRNPGHISLVEVEVMPAEETIKTISKFCGEKIEFKLKKQNIQEEFEKWNNYQLIIKKRRLNRKAKRKRKMILKTIYRGFAPNPTSFDAKGSETGWVSKKQE